MPQRYGVAQAVNLGVWLVWDRVWMWSVATFDTFEQAVALAARLNISESN